MSPFGRWVLEEVQALEATSLVVNGECTITENAALVAKYFELGCNY